MMLDLVGILLSPFSRPRRRVVSATRAIGYRDNAAPCGASVQVPVILLDRMRARRAARA